MDAGVAARWSSPEVLIEWRKADVTAGHLYRLPSGETGVARGIDDQGHLQVEVAGQVVAVTSAEPVRGVYAPEK
jgi:biotin-(acetyl-CoA carboxylase) ligase